MSDNSHNDSGSPQKPPSPQGFQPKVYVIWLALIGMILVLMYMYPGDQTGAKPLEINQVLKLAESGEINSMTVKAEPSGGEQWYKIWGEMKNPALAKSADAAKTDEKAAGTPAKPVESSKPTLLDEVENALEGKSTSEKIPAVIPFSAQGRLTDERYNQLISPNNPYEVREEPASTMLQDILVGLLPFLIIIGVLYFLFTRQLRAAGKGAMSFGKSRAKLLTRDKERVVFRDVAGCDEAKEEVSEVVDFLKDPKKFQRIGGRVPKGVLMVGPPGTGKTLLAKAVAGEADVPFFSISGSDFVEMFVGVGAARVRDMFEQGRKNAPCLIFIDEIDAVGRQRGAGLGGGNDEREQTLNSLLVEMDGFDGHEGVIIIAATNRPDVLDSALLRPGRFDRQVMIDLPDLKGREEILKVHAKKIKMSVDVDLVRVARVTAGFSGADLANLLNEAALVAARYDKSEVQMADVEEARDKIAFGRERRKVMDEEDKRATAYHEAGHALVQAVLKDKKRELHKVTILPRGRALGMAMTTPTKEVLGYSKHDLLNLICMAMAGRIGEEIETGDYSNGAASDIKQATNIARSMVCDWGMSELGPVALGDNQEHIFLAKEITRSQNYSDDTARMIDREIRRIIQEQYDRAYQMIQEHKEAHQKVADALLEYETIEGKHVNEILEFGELRSPVITNTPPSSEPSSPEQDKKKPASDKDEGEEMGPSTAPAGMPA
ncbi:ATP-dependent zinc metalloprotease FtsH [Ruficoccus sp. ZRK36]|uniref:ATP-dependent zinc metalloprotease FtsH n=1 Tax=Ruficoccus sp. ZRK36 TaxID=2866311 RepID=UPI001C7321BF|nr:ATP-dependent zinc metalloprotease FtsH [Ruficoccus sp. ZRK36]QYY35136.1 ATP-dependent zinc metalloprotease FtsH [Ruficoccus sp. ZRK36]